MSDGNDNDVAPLFPSAILKLTPNRENITSEHLKWLCNSSYKPAAALTFEPSAVSASPISNPEPPKPSRMRAVDFFDSDEEEEEIQKNKPERRPVNEKEKIIQVEKSLIAKDSSNAFQLAVRPAPHTELSTSTFSHKAIKPLAPNQEPVDYEWATRGDRDNIVYGCLYAGDIPKYYHRPSGIIGGKINNIIRLRWSPKLNSYISIDNRAIDRSRTAVRSLSLRMSKNVELGENTIQKKTPEPALREIESMNSDFVPIFTPKIEKTPTTEDTIPEYLLVNKKLSEAVDKNKNDIQGWLKLAKHQFNTTATAQSANQKAMAVLTKALTYNPDSRPLLLECLRVSSLMGDPKKTRKLWDHVVTTHQDDSVILHRYWRFQLTSFATYGTKQLSDWMGKRIRTVNDLEMVAALLVGAGYVEKGLAVWMSNIEWAMGGGLDLNRTGPRLVDNHVLGQWWDDEWARVGEIPSCGWNQNQRPPARPFFASDSHSPSIANNDTENNNNDNNSNNTHNNDYNLKLLVKERELSKRRFLPLRSSSNDQTEILDTDLNRIVLWEDISLFLIKNIDTSMNEGIDLIAVMSIRCAEFAISIGSGFNSNNRNSGLNCDYVSCLSYFPYPLSYPPVHILSPLHVNNPQADDIDASVMLDSMQIDYLTKTTPNTISNIPYKYYKFAQNILMAALAQYQSKNSTAISKSHMHICIAILRLHLFYYNSDHSDGEINQEEETIIKNMLSIHRNNTSLWKYYALIQLKQRRQKDVLMGEKILDGLLQTLSQQWNQLQLQSNIQQSMQLAKLERDSFPIARLYMYVVLKMEDDIQMANLSKDTAENSKTVINPAAISRAIAAAISPHSLSSFSPLLTKEKRSKRKRSTQTNSGNESTENKSQNVESSPLLPKDQERESTETSLYYTPLALLNAKKFYENYFVKCAEMDNITEEWVVDMVVLKSFIDYLSSNFNISRARNSMELALNFRFSSSLRQILYERYVQLMVYEWKRTNMAPKEIRLLLLSALTLFPSHLPFIRILIELETRSKIENRLRRFFDEFCPKNTSSILWMSAIAYEMDRLGSYNRISGLFERCLSDEILSGCVLLWKFYIFYLFKTNRIEEAKRVYFRAVRGSPFSKVLWIDSVSLSLDESSCSDIIELMETKDISLSVELNKEESEKMEDD